MNSQHILYSPTTIQHPLNAIYSVGVFFRKEVLVIAIRKKEVASLCAYFFRAPNPLKGFFCRIALPARLKRKFYAPFYATKTCLTVIVFHYIEPFFLWNPDLKKSRHQQRIPLIYYRDVVFILAQKTMQVHIMVGVFNIHAKPRLLLWPISFRKGVHI